MKKSIPKKETARSYTAKETDTILSHLKGLKADERITELFFDNCVIKQTPTEKWFMYGHYNIKIKK